MSVTFAPEPFLCVGTRAAHARHEAAAPANSGRAAPIHATTSHLLNAAAFAAGLIGEQDRAVCAAVAP